MGSVINVISVIIPSWAFKDSRYGHMALSEKDGTPKSSGSSLISFAIPGGIPYFQADPYHEVMTPPNLKNRWFTSSLLIQFLLDMHKLTKNPKNICPHLFLRRRWSSSLALCWPRWAAAAPAAKCQMPRGWPRIWTTSLSSFGLVCWGKFTGKPWKTPYKKWENTYGFRLRFSPTNQSIDFLHLDVGQNGRPLMGPQMEMSSLV